MEDLKNLELNVPEINFILDSLGERRAKDSMNLILKIQGQCMPKEEAAPRKETSKKSA